MQTTLVHFIVVFFALNSFSQNFNSNKFDKLIKEFEKKRFFSGVVLIGTSTGIIYTKTVGFADREKQIPNEISTNFNIASIGKVYTATMIMQLIENGILLLEDTVNKWLPD